MGAYTKWLFFWFLFLLLCFFVSLPFLHLAFAFAFLCIYINPYEPVELNWEGFGYGDMFWQDIMGTELAHGLGLRDRKSVV